MAKPFLPPPHLLEMYLPGEPVRDRFGNERPGKGSWEVVAVSSWWIDKTEEKGDDSVLRTLDYLHVQVPPEVAPPPSSKVRLPDGTEWEVKGNPEDYRHGFHGFNPGLLVVHAVKVEG